LKIDFRDLRRNQFAEKTKKNSKKRGFAVEMGDFDKGEEEKGGGERENDTRENDQKPT